MTKSCCRLVVLLVALLFSGCGKVAAISPVMPSPTTVSGPHGIYQQTILHTTPDPLPCDGQIRNFRWAPPKRIQVSSVLVWIGTTWVNPDVPEARPLIDVWTTVLLPDGFVLNFLGLDHYAAFTGIHQQEKIFYPPLLVDASLPITLQHQCTNYGKTSPQSATEAIVTWLP